MTAAFLQSELTTLISDSKRKNNEVKAAAEKSLADLKAISVTSETQLAGDLIRKPHFIDPFLLACRSQNVKLGCSGAACLQRLVASTAIPRPRLPHLLEAFEAAIPLALDVQLKVLQTLPSLLQLYANDIHGETLSRTLSVSADLSNSKSPIVSSTAGATFQQLVSAVFEAATTNRKSEFLGTDEEGNGDNLRNISDALSVFMDLCALLSDSTTKFVRLDHLPPSSILGTLESLLATHGRFVLNDTEARQVGHGLLLPGLSRLIENSVNFGVVARALRITFILTSQCLDLLSISLGEILHVVLKIVDRAGSHRWKRVLGLEFFRGLCSDFDSLSKVFATYDLKDAQSTLVSGLMASLVRIASEDPSLIGLGRQSTVPASRTVDVSGDNTTAIDIPGSGLTIGNVAHATSTSAGISNEWSTLPTPCLDQFDKSTPPDIPETYIYSLVLGCSSAFSDGLSKYLMPLSVPPRKSTRSEGTDIEETNGEGPMRRSSTRSTSATSKHQQLVNPLSRKHLAIYPSIEICAKMIETCWPAVLASCSTFLNAALDSYFYHILIRTIQKLTQVAGIMELLTPRDALLTTLAKVSVPPNVLALLNTLYGSKPALQHISSPDIGEPVDSGRSPVTSTPRQSIEMTTHTLNVRNLLCLRALLNLGIALGPTMSSTAWIIIFQPMAQVDALMSATPGSRTFQTITPTAETVEGSTMSTLAGEISAVDVARRRLFDSTKFYPESALQQMCQALLKTVEGVFPANELISNQGTNEEKRPKVISHTSTRSISSGWTKITTFEVEVHFVLKTLCRLASVNLDRFVYEQDAESSWDLIVLPLISLQKHDRLQPQLRLLCTNIIDSIIVESSRQPASDAIASNSFSLLSHGLPALQDQVKYIADESDTVLTSVDLEVIQLALSALENVIGSKGEALEAGWTRVFQILGNVVRIDQRWKIIGDQDSTTHRMENQSKLYPTAFKVVRLVISDFLSVLEEQSLRALLGLLEAFGRQQTDLNMSLTTIVLFWNINTLIIETPNYRKFVTKSSQVPDLETDEGLWETMVKNLCVLCDDDRDDVRNAALRMLSRILEASAVFMISTAVNSCIRLLLLPALSEYQAPNCADVKATRVSAFISILKDVTGLIEKHNDLVTGDDTFSNTWLGILQILTSMLSPQHVQIISAVFNSTAIMLSSLNRSRFFAKFTENQSLLQKSWDFWKVASARPLTTNMVNTEAAAAQMRFLIQILAANIEVIGKYQDIADSIKLFITKSVLQVRHDLYTVDVNKLSEEQELLMPILNVLKQLLPTNDTQYASFLVEVIRITTVERLNKSQSPVTKGVRIPTTIALTTTFVERLREFVTAIPNADTFNQTVPVQAIVDVCTTLTITKYSEIPTNTERPLWQASTTLGCTVMTIFRSFVTASTNYEPCPSLFNSINTFITTVLSAPHLEILPKDKRPSAAKLASDTAFDTSRLHELHAATFGILTRFPASQAAVKSYVSILFHHSLATHPHYDDFPRKLDNDPLQSILTVRRGSIRYPDYPVRNDIHFEALQSLLSLTSCTYDEVDSNRDLVIGLANTAAPYVLLRIVHPIKMFLADQPLRYLTPPPAKILTDLDRTLSECLALRVHDQAFKSCTEAFGCNMDMTIVDDGKSHLRILYGFITRLEELWQKLPRLKKGHAWQDRQEGQNIEKTIREWRLTVAQGWGL